MSIRMLDQPQAPGFACPRCGGWIRVTVDDLLARERIFCVNCGLQLTIDGQHSQDLLKEIAEKKARGDLA